MEGGNNPSLQLQQLPLATAAVSVQPHTDSFSYKVSFPPSGEVSIPGKPWLLE